MEFKKFILFFIILLNIAKIISQESQESQESKESQTCTTNLECKETGCCHDDICADSGKCKKRNKFCYGFVGVGAFIITAIIIIHFTRKIKETKKHLELLRKTDPGSLSRNEKYRLSHIPKEILQNKN